MTGRRVALPPRDRVGGGAWTRANERLYATGIYGQFIWIDVPRELVIVKLSSLPAALDLSVLRDHHVAFRTIAAAVR